MAPWLVETIIRVVWKRIKEKRMLKKFKGKRTYALLGGLLTIIATNVLGDGVVTAEDWKELGEAAMVLGAIYTRYLATRS